MLHLGLEEFLASKPVHIIAPISATFFRQRAAQMRVSFKRPRVGSSLSVAHPPSPSSSDPTAKEFVGPTAAAAAPPPSTSEDFGLHRMLDTIMTIQAAHGQLLVDVLMELQALRAELASFRWSPPPPPFDDEF